VSGDTDRRRAELRRHWESFIDGTTSARETAIWAGDQLADYGDQEIMHQGIHRLNDHSWRGLPATRETWVSYHNWLEVVHWYDGDPEAWNYNYFRGFLVRLVDGHSIESALRMSSGFSEYLDQETILAIIEIYVAHE
jgi:hypothetical protein